MFILLLFRMESCLSVDSFPTINAIDPINCGIAHFHVIAFCFLVTPEFAWTFN